MHRWLLFLFLAPAAVLCFLDCGNGNVCPDESTCVSHAAGSGQRWACAPMVNATTCDDVRYSCPPAFSCSTFNGTNDGCANQYGEVIMPLMENGYARSAPPSSSSLTAPSTSLCGVISHDLPSFCSCADVANHGVNVKCLVNLLGLDHVGLEADLLPCAQTASLELDITDTKFGIHHKIAGIEAGIDKQFAVPGLSVKIPIINVQAGVVIDVSLLGNANNLSLSIGIDACAKVLHKNRCGSKLTHKLPIKILSGHWSFGQYCH